MSQAVYAIATMDTKGQEIQYVADRIRDAGVQVVTVDVGTGQRPTVVPDISRADVATHLPKGLQLSDLDEMDRGEAVTAMSEALHWFLLGQLTAGTVAGVIGIGGGGGTALITPAMQALPIGVPKVMVSTMAAGDVAAYVGCADITMMHSVVDVAGINTVSSRVLANAAHAVVGMVSHEAPPTEDKPTIAMTMFGVTTPCVDAVRKTLEGIGYNCLVFHATGAGGRAMEKLIESGLIHGVLDITTTEIADEIVGGVLSAGFERLDAIIKKEIPFVISLGALDMVNFGARETVPEEFDNRRLHVHNAQVTLMRTLPEENRKIAGFIALKLNTATAPWTLLIPEHGVSMIDVEGQPFYDREADTALFEELEELLETNDERRIVYLPHHINDGEFSNALVKEFLNLINSE